MNQTICQTHNLPYDPSKYQGCIACHYKQCIKCHKYNIKHESQYQQCFTCNNANKQLCVQCKTNLVKIPFKFCFQCNQSYKQQQQHQKQPIAPPALTRTIDAPDPGFQPLYSQYPMRFFNQ